MARVPALSGSGLRFDGWRRKSLSFRGFDGRMRPLACLRAQRVQASDRGASTGERLGRRSMHPKPCR
eukprot:13426617-Alexandrium_andersonii.AAC.1